MNPLNHVAIIMDGNGRWGLKYRNSRNAGHKEGLKTVEMIIKASIKQKIKYLTLKNIGNHLVLVELLLRDYVTKLLWIRLVKVQKIKRVTS